jgi:hypothetical protein
MSPRASRGISWWVLATVTTACWCGARACLAIRSPPYRTSTSPLRSRTHTSRPAYCQGHRVAAALPRHVRIPRHLPQLFIDIWMRWAVRQRSQGQPFRLPTRPDLLVSGPMHPLMGYLSHPHPQLRVEILQSAGFAPLQPAEEISGFDRESDRPATDIALRG